jgi:hypothetical protein
MMLTTLDRHEMIARFLDMYAAQFRRPGRADQPAMYRDQMQTIRREAVLAMVLRLESSIPTRLQIKVTVRGAKRAKKSKKKGAKPHPKKKVSMELGIPFLDLFREEFFVALGQWLEWSDADAEEFWRDLELYEQLSRPAPRRSPGRAAKAAASGPFVDRVALLLDPSLMDQARREAGKFQAQLDAAADRVLQKVFSRRREN